MIGSTSVAAEPVTEKISAEHRRFFEEQVRPLLAQRCFKCHGPEKSKGGLRLNSRGAMMVGGESGPAIAADDPKASLLLEAVNYESFEMPPDGKLPPESIAVLTRWVNLGAPWPGDDGAAIVPSSKPKITDEDRRFWSYQPVADPAPPAVPDERFGQQPIDQFIYARLQAAELQPSPKADRAALIRRATFDLWGLPPTPEETAAFVANDSPNAYAELIDRLLASEHYGERWGRHWLDLVRYAESDGYKSDDYRPEAWRYRDYVIRSFNADKPYDQFVQEQLAGDELSPTDPEALIATAFLRHTIYEYNQRDVRTQWDFMINEVTDVTADVFLGLGMSCARCHDHKFDPILQKDYFRLRAFFAPLVQNESAVLPSADAQVQAEWEEKQAEWEAKTADLRAQIAAIEQPYLDRAGDVQLVKFPPDVQPILKAKESDRDPLGKQLARLALRQARGEYKKIKFPEKLKEEEKKRWLALHKELKTFESLKPKPLPVAYSVADVGPIAPPTRIPGKRNGEDIEPGFLTLLDPNPAVIEPPAGLASTGRRTALATWITDPSNPLSTRVIVNRVWQKHFGRGLVATPSDFGRLGETPSHPQLLDWLTRRFLENDWQLKPLHRMIMLSETYQQAAVVENSEAAMTKDPQNLLLWRMNIRRLEAEQVRDAMLSVSGELKESDGGPSVAATAPQRGVYAKVYRNTRDPLFDVFDGPDGFSSTPIRNVTTTPTQSLLMMNGDWPLKRAAAFAARLRKETQDPAEQIRRAYLLAYGRPPKPAEASAMQAFLTSSTPAEPAEEQPSATTAVFDGKPDSRLVSPFHADLPQGDFTVEAVIRLDSLYPDATVRTIASQWDSQTSHRGWSLGVTSTKSAFAPRNLILQLIGDTPDGKTTYEVIASNLRPELKKTYYVAVSLKVSDTSLAGATFYLKDLSDPKAVLQTANVAHKVAGNFRPKSALTIGGRDESKSHIWHGTIDDVRLSSATLPEHWLLPNTPRASTDETVGLWRFEPANPLANTAADRLHLTAAQHINPDHQALVDLCHILFNTNEFLYVD